MKCSLSKVIKLGISSQYIWKNQVFQIKQYAFKQYMKQDILNAKVGGREWEKVDGRHCVN